MTSNHLLLAVPAAFLLLSAPAMAEDFKVNTSLTLASDYIWRGVSQTDSSPAVFGAVSASYGKFYFGGGAENVDFAGIHTEYDLWAGYNIPLGSANLDLGVVRYGYVDAPANIDTLEVKATLSRAFAHGSVAGTVMHTSNYFGSDLAATYYELSASHALGAKWSVSGAVGYQTLDNSSGDYSTWNIGVGYAVTPKVGLDLRYSDNDVDSPARIYDAKLVASVKVSL